MPDLLTHLLFALILGEIFNIKKRSLVVLGALLPDLIAKLDLILFYLGINDIFSFASFHTPFMVFLVTILISRLFQYPQRHILFPISLGFLSHFALDLTMKHYAAYGVRLLFPLTMYNYSFQLFWPDQSIYLLAFGILVYSVILSVKKYSYPNKKYKTSS